MAEIDRSIPLKGGGVRVRGINRILYRTRQFIEKIEEEERRLFIDSLTDEQKNAMEAELQKIKSIYIGAALVPTMVSVLRYNKQVEEIENKYKELCKRQ